MGFKCGIVGLPNVGKSTLFNALTKANIAASNYPFCTIDPNIGMVNVPDPRLDTLRDLVTPERVVPTTIQFVDIAGLVKGAAQGEGLGNQFLAHIRETDAIAHIIRCFDDPDIVHVHGEVNPESDIETISLELCIADLETVEKGITRLSKKSKGGDKEAKFNQIVLEKAAPLLTEGKALRLGQWEDEELAVFKLYGLLTIKPVLIIANTDEAGLYDDNLKAKIEQIAAGESAEYVILCAQVEAEIAQLDDSERAEFIEAMGLPCSGLDLFIQAGYKLLDLQTFFTAGKKEVRAWTVQNNASAQDAAGVIHTDFARGFIRAEVISFDDFIACKGESGARDAGKLRSEGKSYVTQDGDIMHFRFNV